MLSLALASTAGAWQQVPALHDIALDPGTLYFPLPSGSRARYAELTVYSDTGADVCVGEFRAFGPDAAAAGMDFALATGRGEPLLTQWPGIDGPLVADADAFQIGERYSEQPPHPIDEFKGTELSQITAQKARQVGIMRSVQQIHRWLVRRRWCDRSHPASPAMDPAPCSYRAICESCDPPAHG